MMEGRMRASTDAERLVDFGDAVSIRPMNSERLDFVYTAAGR
jgi:hypothetical protein